MTLPKTLLIVAALVMVGCKKNEPLEYVSKSNSGDTVVIKDALFYTPNLARITVTNCLVSNGYPYGWVGKGSVLFNLEESVKGHRIEVIRGVEVVYKVFVPAKKLASSLDKISYEYSDAQFDSLTTSNNHGYRTE
jgi:hypothetical protein